MAAAHRGQAGLDVFDRAGEVLDQLGAVVEADDEELILRIGGLDELQDRLLGAISLEVMEPERSKMMPIETGASSLAKLAIFCSPLFSKT